MSIEAVLILSIALNIVLALIYLFKEDHKWEANFYKESFTKVNHENYQLKLSRYEFRNNLYNAIEKDAKIDRK